MAVSLTTLLPPTRSGRTLFVSSSLLGAFALLQMAMLCWHLLRSGGSGNGSNLGNNAGSVARAQAPAEGSAIHFAETTEPSTSSIDVPYHGNPLRTDAGPSSMVTSPPAVASEPLPTPAAPAIDRPTPAPVDRTSVAGLIEDARRLRLDGDANTALAELRQAQLADPSNPQVIAELGITYEAMQLPDRAFEQWQRLYSMGDAIGPLYYLADEKLHSAPAAAPAPGTALPGLTAQAPVDPTGSGRDAAGFQDTAMLKITDIHAEEVDDDPAAAKKVILKIVVKNRPGIAIDPKRVKIETYFYDLLDGKDVVQTDAQTGYAWLTKPVNWANDRSEVLETTYMRPKAAPSPTPGAAVASDDAGHTGKHGHRGKGHESPAETPPPATPAPVRTYLGYTVRLYYDRQLQDVQADPLRLLQQFPPPLTLPED
jgi:hypothetical protein